LFTGRRRLLGYLLGFSVISTLLGVLTPILGYLWPPVLGAGAAGARVLIATLADIPPGQGKVLPLGNQPIVVVHTQDGKVRAYSAICTHLGCVVQWDEERQLILCPCHDGRFNALNGGVISGPVPSPLPAVAITIEGQDIYAGGA
jgi:cytochrome b6-f complex iron-sulfur subunit